MNSHSQRVPHLGDGLLRSFEYFNCLLLPDQIGKPSLVPRRSHDVVVHPMVIASSRLSHQHAVVSKPMSPQPRFRDSAMLLRSGRKKSNDVSFFVPLV